MRSAAFEKALEAFGGWSGLCAFYFSALAFPVYYALRTPQDQERYNTNRQRRQLRVASGIVLISSLLCYIFPAAAYLAPHINPKEHSKAHLLDWAIHFLTLAILAPLSGLLRLRVITTTDRASLERDIPSPTPTTWTRESRHRVKATTARYFAESTWLALFTLYLLNIPAAILQVTLGMMLRHNDIATIPWYLFPLCTLPGHVTVFHAAVGVVEAWYHPLRVEAVESALDCESKGERAGCWALVLASTTPKKILARALQGLSRTRATDCECGAAVVDACVDEKGAFGGAESLTQGT